MKRLLRVLLLLVLLVPAAGGVGLWAWGSSRHAAAAPQALEALRSDDSVVVAEEPYLSFAPAAGPARMGVVLYPGANCDIRGYAPLLRRFAEAGYFVVAVPMPLGFAFMAPDRAEAVFAAYPQIARWAIIGHSLGGAMAAGFVYRHPQSVTGLVIWDSYPPDSASLAGYTRPVWHVHRATPEGNPPAAFAAHRYLYPQTSRWVAIPGGIHMFFGSFGPGGYVEDWEPSITRDEHQARAVAATLEALAQMETG